MLRSKCAVFFDSALGLAARTGAQRAYKQFVRNADNAIDLQERVLLNLIKSNTQSDFGRDHRFERIRTSEDFRNAVPIREFEAIRPYVEKVMQGREQALFGPRHRVLMLAMTSGSTDKPKYIPLTRQFVREYRRGWNAFGGKALLDHPRAFMRPILQVTSPLDVERSPCGLPCGSISGLLAREQPGIVRRYYAAPPEIAQITDAESRYYAIMRFAVPRDVGWIVTASPATPLTLARTAAKHADRLIRDIHDGTLHPPDILPRQTAAVLKSRLAPDPQTARRLETLQKTNDCLLPRDYWRLEFLANWTGGTLALHLRDFPQFFGATPVRDIGLLATEGRVCVGLEKGTSAGLMDAAAGFFEFVEFGGSQRSEVKRCHELDSGGVYRVIMTNAAGLYRYDIGDCVRVVGYRGRAPLLEFLHRGTRTSSMTGEKLSEWQVTTAMRNVRAAVGVEARCFVVAPVWSDPPYYQLHIDETSGDAHKVARGFDEELCRLNFEYAGKRSSHRLGAVRVHQVASSVFERWEKARMQTQRASEQYKAQYLFTVPGEDHVLLNLVAARGTEQERDKGTAFLETHPAQAAHQ